jgi:ubiquinone/menaquinone biosynthesis C-methylase UbiE
MDVPDIYNEYVAEHFDRDFFGLNEECRTIALNQIQKHLSHPPDQILDLGVGTGEFLKALTERFPKAFFLGIDASEKMIEVARSKFKKEVGERIRWIHDDAHRLRQHLEASQVDLAILHFILNYVDHARVLGDIHWILNKGGYFSISNCTADSFPILHGLASQFVSEEFLQSTFHVPESHESLKTTLSQRGFEEVEEEIFHKEIVFENFDSLMHFVLHSGWLSNPFFLHMTDEQISTYREFGRDLFPLKEEFRAVVLLAKKR